MENPAELYTSSPAAPTASPSSSSYNDETEDKMSHHKNSTSSSTTTAAAAGASPSTDPFALLSSLATTLRPYSQAGERSAKEWFQTHHQYRQLRLRVGLALLAFVCVVAQIGRSFARIHAAQQCWECDYHGVPQLDKAVLEEFELLDEQDGALDGRMGEEERGIEYELQVERREDSLREVRGQEAFELEKELLEGEYAGDEKTDAILTLEGEQEEEYDDPPAPPETEGTKQEKKRAVQKRMKQWQEDDSNSNSLLRGDSGPANRLKDTTIRSWGCARNETPFIFVHIGKAGGGGVRSRMAASALHYNRTAWHRTNEDATYFYPVYDQHKKSKLHKGVFASSKMTNLIPPTMTEYEKDFTFEGFGPCAATTPLGQALACPLEEQGKPYCRDVDRDNDNTRCDLIYMGHNLIGNELHWLPTEYLLQWWKTTPWYTGDDKTDRVFRAISDRNSPIPDCPEGPYGYRTFKRNYRKCFQPKESQIDIMAKEVVGGWKSDYNLQWAKIIASLPTLRVTVLREPFSWLASKLFWHPRHYSRNGEIIRGHIDNHRNNNRAKMDNLEGKETPRLVKCDDIDEMAYGWGTVRAITYILYLCGEHCMAGLADSSLSIGHMEQQAAYNLRNSFAVVGLLQKTDEFYDMVSKRVYYVNTALNPTVKGKKHGSGDYDEALRCKKLYKDPAFQQKVMDKSPAIAALHRLYNIAVEVNEFQTKELEQCPELNHGLDNVAQL